MQAHTLGEVDILGKVLLKVSSGTILTIFNEIGSYLTEREREREREQKISWHSFLRHGVYSMDLDNDVRNVTHATRARCIGLNFGTTYFSPFVDQSLHN